MTTVFNEWKDFVLDNFYDCYCIVCDLSYQFGEEPICHSCDKDLEEDQWDDDFVWPPFVTNL